MKAILLAFLGLVLLASANPCPGIHIFAARETTAPPGYGLTGELLNKLQAKYKWATSEAIEYPACGGQDECGGVSYGDSVYDGAHMVSLRVNAFHIMCPKTKFVLLGYSQGAQIIDDAVCGGGDPEAGIYRQNITILNEAFKRMHAVVLMGNPRFVHGKFYNHGTCTEQGFAAREKSFDCPYGNLVQSICDTQDLFCCNGTSLEHHGQYVKYYGQYMVDYIDYMLADEEPERGGFTTLLVSGSGEHQKITKGKFRWLRKR
ncbi:Acetylxylan esterase 2 [Cladobotryum mycophilum]|uniref:Acetylxylan esterase 2 n=1 Tax=Cladobotryum mycophilum TaxID=491253 RepID=A0ABR0SG90_9HYPO